MVPSSWRADDADTSIQHAFNALETYKRRDPSKVIVRFKAVGNAPIMKQNDYTITASHRFQAVIMFLRKELRWKAGDPLFTYVNLAFAPAPDDTVSNLSADKLIMYMYLQSFATGQRLIVNYSTTAAWG
ncbi:hypothetical protein EIP91_002802 [Steccherinum ochraceum]|uniref:Ubiquitin-like protein ATG12 n=1 Tax=Steccherinum ochraceum TaxID=92696 RepID=A0A4R0RDY9_9APHY|nr:hypothetical protein EIP91_002802 [Steccherinum ochraceum]